MEMSRGGRDLISSLPDEILGKILALLPTKVAASTSILSKSWRNLLLLVDTLYFDDSVVVYPNKEEATSGSRRFTDFVDKTLALLSDSRIKKFSLYRGVKYFGEEQICLNDLFNRWIWTAMEQHAITELHVYASPGARACLETKLFTSTTLVKLTISGYDFLIADRFFLPALKSLSVLSAMICCDALDCLILGCPVLEELFMRHDCFHEPPGLGTWVESASIKRIVVSINLPKLSLKLWESTEDYDYSDDDDADDYFPDVAKPKAAIFGDVTDLVTGISNITTLHLSPDSLEAFHFCCKSMPVFNNLLKLSLESNKEKGWQVMPLLLKNCSNLQSLVIKGLVHRVTNRCGDACACLPKKPRQKKEEEEICYLWTCQVKVLEISDYGGSFQELRQMRHFLGKLECLETVKVDVNNNKSKFLRANLLALPRLSSKCNIQFN